MRGFGKFSKKKKARAKSIFEAIAHARKGKSRSNAGGNSLLRNDWGRKK